MMICYVGKPAKVYSFFSWKMENMQINLISTPAQTTNNFGLLREFFQQIRFFRQLEIVKIEAGAHRATDQGITL